MWKTEPTLLTRTAAAAALAYVLPHDTAAPAPATSLNSPITRYFNRKAISSQHHLGLRHLGAERAFHFLSHRGSRTTMQRGNHPRRTSDGRRAGLPLPGSSPSAFLSCRSIVPDAIARGRMSLAGLRHITLSDARCRMGYQSCNNFGSWREIQGKVPSFIKKKKKKNPHFVTYSFPPYYCYSNKIQDCIVLYFHLCIFPL